jgi:hypothetical protein
MSSIIDTGKKFPILGLQDGLLFLRVNSFNDGLFVFFSGQWLKIGKVTTAPAVPKIEVQTTEVSEVQQQIFSSSDKVTFGGNF